MAPFQLNDFSKGLMTTDSHVLITGGQGFHIDILGRHNSATEVTFLYKGLGPSKGAVGLVPSQG